MRTERRAQVRTQLVIAALGVAMIARGVWQGAWETDWLETWLWQHAVLGAGLYVDVVAASVVLGKAGWPTRSRPTSASAAL